MGILNKFNFDGVDSSKYGVYISGEATYNAPARRGEKVSIPGRNGDLIIDEGAYENIPVTYRSFIGTKHKEEFDARIEALRAELVSRGTYRRLTDTYHPDEFRLGAYREGLEVEPTMHNRAGEFDVVFDCKPQRFLTAGEEEINVGEWGETEEVSGEIATFEGKSNTGIKSLIAAINPIQDLNGYDSPWPGGARKNKLKITATTQTINGVTFTFREDGRIVINGTPTNPVTLYLNQSLGLATGNYKYFAKGIPSSTIGGVYVEDANGTRLASAMHDSTSGVALNGSVQKVWFYFNVNQTFSNAVVELMITDSSVTDSTFLPYENICPISGWSGVNVTRCGKNLLNLPTYEEFITCPQVGNYYSYAIKVKPNTSYYLSVSYTDGYDPSGKYVYLLLTNNPTSNNPWIAVAHHSDPPLGGAITSSADGYLYLRLSKGDSAYVHYPNIRSHALAQLEEGTSATSYEPYQGETINKALGRTVYGGTLDLISGELVSGYSSPAVFNGNSTVYTSATNVTGKHRYMFTGVLSLVKKPASDNAKVGIYCNKLIEKTAAETYRATEGISVGTNGYIYVYIEECATMTIDEFKTWLNSNPLTIYYPLATPLTYQLTPEQINAVKGINNVWADSGDVTVIFGDDPNIMANPTLFEALPLIEVTGQGSLFVDGEEIVISGNDTKYIDSEIMEVYAIESGEVVSKNDQVVLNEFPKLGKDTRITWNGLSSVKVIPRWWTL